MNVMSSREFNQNAGNANVWQRNTQYLLQIEVVFTYSSCNRGIPQDYGNAPEYGGHAGLP